MKHPSIRELFRYWDQERGERPAPERADIQPGAIRLVLADTFILSAEVRDGNSFRVAGTRVCALFGGDLRGVKFFGLWTGASRHKIAKLLAGVAHQSVGLAALPPTMKASLLH